MSIRRTDYIIKGYIVPFQLKSVMDGSDIDWYSFDNIPEGYELIVSCEEDQENPNYVAFGKLLNETDDQGPFYNELILVVPSDEEIMEIFNHTFRYFVKVDDKPKLYIIKSKC